jgi:hypothetical protein
MRLSEWRAAAPARDAVAPKVSAVVDPVLVALGAGPDPHCWIAWGEEAGNRFTVFVPTDPGLIVCFVRVNVPGEGPRATTKLVRWSKATIGELAIETQAGHRMLSFQLESQVLRGVDAEADRAAAFALRVIAAIDGRPLPPVEALGGASKTTRSAATSRAAKAPAKAGSGATKPATKPGTKPAARSATKPATKPAARSATGAPARLESGKAGASARSDADR